MGTAVTLDLHSPCFGDVQSSSLVGREARCPGNSLSPSLRQQGELWWCSLAVGQWVMGWNIGVLGMGSPPPA